ncbi:MAG: hypothetical protein ACK465_00985 [Flavobacteriia bacterium]
MSNQNQQRKAKVKRPYTAPQIEVVVLDQEISLVMASESPTPPPEFLKIPLLKL